MRKFWTDAIAASCILLLSMAILFLFAAALVAVSPNPVNWFAVHVLLWITVGWVDLLATVFTSRMTQWLWKPAHDRMWFGLMHFLFWPIIFIGNSFAFLAEMTNG